jgi:hypothetical protein
MPRRTGKPNPVERSLALALTLGLAFGSLGH